jgi:cell division septum initiation protein DivIVA
MTNTVIEGILSELYNMIENAKNLPLSADKCIVERDKVLDLLDEAFENLPADIKKAKDIVDACNALTERSRRDAEETLSTAQTEADAIMNNARTSSNSMANSAKAEADTILRSANGEATSIIAKAKAQAADMVTKEAIYQETQRQCNEMVEKANTQISELKKINDELRQRIIGYQKEEVSGDV